jgi:hypothetical protein
MTGRSVVAGRALVALEVGVMLLAACSRGDQGGNKPAPLSGEVVPAMFLSSTGISLDMGGAIGDGGTGDLHGSSMLELPHGTTFASAGIVDPDKRAAILAPLAGELAALPSRTTFGRDLIIASDPSNPYGLLWEYCLHLARGVSGSITSRSWTMGATRVQGSAQRAASSGSSFNPNQAQPAPAGLGLAVLVTDSGVSFKTSVGYVGPDCTLGNRGVTVPLVAGTYDYSGVTACAKRLKGDRLDSTVTLAATAALPIGLIVRVMDALKGASAELFPVVQFASPR